MGGHIKHGDGFFRMEKWDPWPLARFLRATYRAHKEHMTALLASHAGARRAEPIIGPSAEDPYAGDIDLDEHVDALTGVEPLLDDLQGGLDDEDDPVDDEGELLEISEDELERIMGMGTYGNNENEDEFDFDIDDVDDSNLQHFLRMDTEEEGAAGGGPSNG